MSWPAGVTEDDQQVLAEAGWKAVPKNVKAMYVKGWRRSGQEPEYYGI